MNALCSLRVLSPLSRWLAAHEALELLPDELRAAGADERVPVELVHGAFERAVEYFGDELLGLKLGASICLGEMGGFDYLLRSAPTVRDALETASRYSSLQADGYRISLERFRQGYVLRPLDETSWPRVIADMSMSAAYKLHVGARAPFSSRLECWLPYAAPADPTAYEAFFPGAALRFDAPFHAFAFDESYERAPQPAADAALHSLLRERFDAILGDVARVSALRYRVKLAIERQLRHDHEAAAPTVARSLHMSRRTLSRKLRQEGTTFADELDSVRRDLALSYVRNSERSFSEVTALLGFSHVESFHRAFKRWTGTTPLAQRTRAAAEGARAGELTPRA